MARVIQCDRCKKILKDTEVDKMKRLKVCSIKTTFADNTIIDSIDICEDCFELVKDILNGN